MSTRDLLGPLVTTSGQVISGAGSPGQQVWIGSRARSMSSPVSTTSCIGPSPTVRGFIARTVLSSGSISIASRQPLGGSGWRRKASVSPTSRSPSGSRFMPHATRSTVPKRLTSTGMSKRVPSSPTTFSNSTAGPSSAMSRVWISVISKWGETGACDPAQAARAFQAGDEVAQRSIGHGHLGGRPTFMGRCRPPSSPRSAAPPLLPPGRDPPAARGRKVGHAGIKRDSVGFGGMK